MSLQAHRSIAELLPNVRHGSLIAADDHQTGRACERWDG